MLSADQLVHTARITPYLGAGAGGELYGDAFDLPCYYEGTRALVRDSSGDEVVSEGRFFANPTDIPAGSKVTIKGRTSWIISVSDFEDLQGLDHIEVAIS